MGTLTFHGLGHPPTRIAGDERRVWVDVDRFRRVLDVACERDLGVTFDDGNLTDLTVALPELTERGLAATFFVLAGRLGEPDYLAAADLAELREAGMALGSHGYAHRDWRRCDAAELEVELDEAREQLVAAWGSPIGDAACPFGSYDRRVLGELRRRGYGRVFTSDGLLDARGWIRPRYTVHADTTVDELVDALDRPAAGVSTAIGRAKRLAKRWR